MDMSAQQFCLRWSNYQTNVLTAFDELLTSQSLVDCTLACDGTSIKAHKLVLSVCSPFFQHLFMDNPCKHPIVIIKDISIGNLKSIVHFMYKGEVNVSQEQLNDLLKAAETLKVKGLAELTNFNQTKETSDIPSVPLVLMQPLQPINLQQPISPVVAQSSPIPLEQTHETVSQESTVKIESENEEPAMKEQIKVETQCDEDDSDDPTWKMDSEEESSSAKPSPTASPTSGKLKRKRKKEESFIDQSKDDSNDSFVDPSTFVEQMLSIQMQPDLIGGGLINQDYNSTSKSNHPKKRNTAMYDSCPICHKKFANHNNYIVKQHMSLHDQDPVKFTCDVCSKSFRWRNNLYVHRKKYHSGIAVLPSTAHVNIVVSKSLKTTVTVPTTSKSEDLAEANKSKND